MAAKDHRVKYVALPDGSVAAKQPPLVCGDEDCPICGDNVALQAFGAYEQLVKKLTERKED